MCILCDTMHTCFYCASIEVVIGQPFLQRAAHPACVLQYLLPSSFYKGLIQSIFVLRSFMVRVVYMLATFFGSQLSCHCIEALRGAFNGRIRDLGPSLMGRSRRAGRDSYSTCVISVNVGYSILDSYRSERGTLRYVCRFRALKTSVHPLRCRLHVAYSQRVTLFAAVEEVCMYVMYVCDYINIYVYVYINKYKYK